MSTPPSHRLSGGCSVPVHSLRPGPDPWKADPDDRSWTYATRCDDGETVGAPPRFFVPVEPDPPGAAPVAWVVTADHLAARYPDDFTSQVGTGCARFQREGWAVATNVPSDAVAEPVRFRLFDDDGEHYYSGLIRADWLNGDEERAFAPLTWAANDAGCTRMDYLDRGTWTTL